MRPLSQGTTRRGAKRRVDKRFAAENGSSDLRISRSGNHSFHIDSVSPRMNPTVDLLLSVR
jgi:hypothetical protein